MREHERRDYRCNECGRLLFRAYLAKNSRVETRCPKCGRMNVFERKEEKVARAT